MYWYVADETNFDFVAGKFFIYGGLAMSDQQMLDLTRAVEEIRQKYGYERGDSLKFHTRARPASVSIEDSKAAKRDVIAAVERLGIRMIVYVILHDIAQAKADHERMAFALNTVTWAYKRFLRDQNDAGVFMMDRADEQHAHLASLFQHGIKVGGSHKPVDDRIKFFGMTSNNASHVSSAVDIALGGFRYCVNAAVGDGQQVVAADIFPPLARIVWSAEVGGVRYVRNFGFHPSPKTVNSAKFQAIYDELYAKLTEYSDTDSKQEPPAEASAAAS